MLRSNLALHGMPRTWSTGGRSINGSIGLIGLDLAKFDEHQAGGGDYGPEPRKSYCRWPRHVSMSYAYNIVRRQIDPSNRYLQDELHSTEQLPRAQRTPQVSSPEI